MDGDGVSILARGGSLATLWNQREEKCKIQLPKKQENIGHVNALCFLELFFESSSIISKDIYKRLFNMLCLPSSKSMQPGDQFTGSIGMKSTFSNCSQLFAVSDSRASPLNSLFDQASNIFLANYKSQQFSISIFRHTITLNLLPLS